VTTNTQVVRKLWTWTVWSLIFALVMIFVVTGLNIWGDANRGKPFDWRHVMYAVGFVAFSGVMYVFMRLIHKFVLAKSLHDERRQ
jgi:cytochrome b subunit of formate dehydrogenase